MKQLALMVFYICTSHTVRAPTLLPVALSLSIDNYNNSNASLLSSSLPTREEFVHLKASLGQKISHLLINFLPSLGDLILKLHSFIRNEYRHIGKEKFRNSICDFPLLSK